MSEKVITTFAWDDFPLAFAPQRIVSLVPSITESLFDLDLGGRVVGRTDYCLYPRGQVERIPSVGGTKNPDLERIKALNPQLVIVNREENRREDAEALLAAGIPVWATFPKTVHEALNLLWVMMDVFDHPAMIPRVRLIEYTYDWLNNIALAHEHQPVKVFCPIWLDPLMTFNADTYAHDVLRTCGGQNVFAERERQFPLAADVGDAAAYADDDPRISGRDRRYPRIAWDEVVAFQPDVILLPSEPFAFDATHLPQFQALNVPAAHKGRVHLIEGSWLTWHGTRVAYAMDQLPRLIRPKTG